eukprot:TRINITY_DN68110_c6_g17_i1.p1 TRINITY_DN68110_c6_g17~~TRINITY_DN68110_c6_g17_i1.p1  ORF type:complete len:345 (+),score=27.78 TRINITY_DN68110_c6_g17_i1:40-1035(+)
MKLLVTGGTGFVMSHVVHQWLKSSPENNEAIVLDSGDKLEQLTSLLKSVKHRIRLVQGDVRDKTTWDLLTNEGITHLVHGAALTPTAEQERLDPATVMSVNTLGTCNALEWARTTSVQRTVCISSDAVLNVPGLARGSPIEQTQNMYAISKFTIEEMVKRYRALFPEMSVTCVRLSDVWGPLDRDTPTRKRHNPFYWVAQRAAAQKPIRVRTTGADFKHLLGPDSIYAPDVGRAIDMILKAEVPPKHALYNASYGQPIPLEEVIQAFGGSAEQVQPPEMGDIGDLADDHYQRESEAYCLDNSGLKQEFNWAPTALNDAASAYLQWLSDNGN